MTKKEGYPRGGRKKKVKVYPGSFKKAPVIYSDPNRHRRGKRGSPFTTGFNPEMDRIGLMCHENW